jgi:hypothetical protein
MWRRWLIVIVAATAVLAASFWAELQYQPQIGDSHQQQRYPSDAIGNSSKKPIFPAEFFVWIDGLVDWTDAHHDFVLAIANVFLAAFTLALFAATFGFCALPSGKLATCKTFLPPLGIMPPPRRRR